MFSSTAAYLMNCSTWDDKAEEYLRKVVNRERFNEVEDAGIPCAWPTTVFETSWAVATLLSAGAAITTEDASRIGDYLRRTLATQSGLVGFGKSTPPG